MAECSIHQNYLRCRFHHAYNHDNNPSKLGENPHDYGNRSASNWNPSTQGPFILQLSLWVQPQSAGSLSSHALWCSWLLFNPQTRIRWRKKEPHIMLAKSMTVGRFWATCSFPMSFGHPLLASSGSCTRDRSKDSGAFYLKDLKPS